jgi:hypothetical protein
VSAFLQDSGEYRVGIRDARDATPEVELTVLRGVADLETPQGRARVHSGQQISATATEPAFGAAERECFVDRRVRSLGGKISARRGSDPRLRQTICRKK